MLIVDQISIKSVEEIVQHLIHEVEFYNISPDVRIKFTSHSSYIPSLI